MDERAFGARLSRRLEHVQGPGGVRVEVVEGNGRGAVMGRLGGGVNDDGGPQRAHEFEEAGAVPHVQLVVGKAPDFPLQPLLIPARVAGGTEENAPLVVVESVDGVALLGEIEAYFAPDKPRGPGDQDRAAHDVLPCWG